MTLTIDVRDATDRQLLRECLAQIAEQGWILMALKDTAQKLSADADAAAAATAKLVAGQQATHTLLAQLQAMIADLRSNTVDQATLDALEAIDQKLDAAQTATDTAIAGLTQDVIDNQP